MIRNIDVTPGVNKKLIPKYKGPYRVSKVLNKNRYMVRDVPNFQASNKPYNSIMSPDRMKPWITIEASNDVQDNEISDD